MQKAFEIILRQAYYNNHIGMEDKYLYNWALTRRKNR